MKKKGFTLVEIIICIALIAVIGTFSVVSVNKAMNIKGEAKLLENNASNFRDALEVYLSTHTEVLENVNNNAKAAVVSLELLKNEGLIKDNLDIDYKNNYFTLANAVLMPPDGDGSDECSDQIEIKTFASWELDDDATEVVYICPRAGSGGGGDNADLIDRINKLETAFSLMTIQDRNYVLFDVNTRNSEKSYWPDNDKQDLWSILKNDINSGEFKLLYSQDITNDNSQGWSQPEMVTDKYNTNNSRKKLLYDSINSNLVEDIILKNYYYRYHSDEDLTPTYTYNDKFGTIDMYDNISSPSLSGRKFFVGTTYGTNYWTSRLYYGWVHMNNSKFEYSTVQGCYCLDPDRTEEYINKYDAIRIAYNGTYYRTNYVPVITVKYKNLLNNYEDYPDSYKEKYSSCDTTKLGSKDCPKIIKLNSGNLSWEN